MPLENRKTLSNLRLSMAEEALDDARADVEEKRYRSASNRAYYAAFYAMRSVLALDGIDRKHHSGIISEFQRLYIKTNVFDTGLSKIITSLFDTRSQSDYEDILVISADDALQQLKNAETVVKAVKTYLQSLNL